MKTLTAEDVSQTVNEAIVSLDDLLAIGNLEQRCIIAMKFEEMAIYSRVKEQYLNDKRSLFKTAEEMLNSAGLNALCKQNRELKKQCRMMVNKSFLLTLQNKENMGLLNQIKSFFSAAIGVHSAGKSYTAHGKAKVSGPTVSLFIKKV